MTPALLLSARPKFDAESFEKILQTCVGIANLSPYSRGYVIVGVADKASTARRVDTLFDTKSLPFGNLFVSGIEHEILAAGKNLDQFFQELVEKIRASKLSDDLRAQILRDIKIIRYFNKTVVIFEISAQEEPSSYDDDFFIREGANLRVLGKGELAPLIKRFIKK